MREPFFAMPPGTLDQALRLRPHSITAVASPFVRRLDVAADLCSGRFLPGALGPASPSPPTRPQVASYTILTVGVQTRCMRILVVDDEPRVRSALKRALMLDGYEVEVAADGSQALRFLSTDSADAIVLDILMPEVNGIEVCRRLRKSGDRTPVLVLSARDAVADRVAGLDVGADDYLVKPFDLEELLARLRALLRRTSGTSGEVLRFADLVLDATTHEVHRGDRPIELTRTEFLLLELFLEHPRQVLTPDVISERVWGQVFGPHSNSIKVFIGYLRRKMEAGGEVRLIHTVRGVGYVLRPP